MSPLLLYENNSRHFIIFSGRIVIVSYEILSEIICQQNHLIANENELIKFIGTFPKECEYKCFFSPKEYKCLPSFYDHVFIQINSRLELCLWLKLDRLFFMEWVRVPKRERRNVTND